MAEKTKSKTSPKGGKRGCLCEDGTYSSKCCNGDLESQGIGSDKSHGISDVTVVDNTRTISNSRG